MGATSESSWSDGIRGASWAANTIGAGLFGADLTPAAGEHHTEAQMEMIER